MFQIQGQILGLGVQGLQLGFSLQFTYRKQEAAITVCQP